MKKTLIAIIAVMLVLVLTFSLFACKDKNSNTTDPGTKTNTDTNKDKDKDKEKTETKGTERNADNLGDYEAATDLMLTYADQYLTNNATDKEDVSVALKTAINKQAASIEGKPISSIGVKLVDGTYQLEFTYKDNSYYTYHDAAELKARTAEKGEYAGYEFADNGDSADFLASLATVYNAFLRTFQQAKEEGGDFGEDYKLAATGGNAKGYTFGASVEAAFFLNYGVGEGQIGPMSYGIKTYGTLGYDAKDTEVALEIIDELANKAIIGLYYKDSTLYLSIDVNGYTQKKYLDEADINAIVGEMLGGMFAEECEHSYKDGYCTKCGKVEPEAKTGVPFYEHEPNYTSIKDALIDLTNGNSLVGTVIGVVGAITTSRSSVIEGGTRYQYKIELGTLLDKILGNSVLNEIISGTLNPVTASILPQFDLGSFKGVGGDLVLSFDVTSGSAATLSGVQLAYNVAQKDFRWSKLDTERKIYGPVNVAITVSDFDIGEKTVSVQKNQYTRFSPLQGEITADISYADANSDEFDGNYKLIARADFNPFTIFAGGELRDGAAEIILDKANGDAFAHVYMHNFTYSEDEGYDCTVTVYYNGTYYETLASQSDFFQNTFADFILPLVSRDTDSNLKAISAYVWDLIDQFSKPYTYDDFTKAMADYKAEIEALAVTKHNIETKADNSIVDHGVFASSKWLDAIKDNALEEIDTAATGLNADSTKAELKAAIKEIARITKEAKSDYKAQLKLEGKYESIMDGFNPIALLTNFSDLKALFINDANGAANPSVFDFDLNLTNPKLWANLDASAYNSVIDILKNAIPKLEDLDANAAKVKVDLNYTKANEGKLYVNVTYKDYLVDVVVDLNGCIEDYKLKSKGTMTADILVKIPDEEGKVISYVYAVEAVFNDWDKNNGTITVTFKESDGEEVSRASDTFVNLVVTQSWDGEAYRGFDAVLTLNSRKADGSAMNDAHTYTVSGKYNDTTKMYTLSIAECDITLSIGAFEGGIDKTNTLAYDIPAPWCSFKVAVKMGERDVEIGVSNLKITTWGDDVTIKGIDTEGKEVIRNTADTNAADVALEELVEDLFIPFFYEAK